MTLDFDNNKPIFIQIRELIEDQILSDQLEVGDQAPSTNQLVKFYKINHATVSKGVSQLVDEGILYKKRGVGMFVADKAKRKIIKKRKAQFESEYVVHFLKEANKLGMTEEEIIELIKRRKGSEQDDL